MTRTMTAGYVVTDGATLYGMGDTAEEAWAEVTFNETERGIPYNRDALKLYPVSSELLAKTKAGVFGVMWKVANGIVCTVTESRAA